MVLSTDLIKLKFPALALLEASAIEILYSGQFTSPTRLGKKIRTHYGTSNGFLKSLYRRTFLPHIVHNESCLNLLDTKKKVFWHKATVENTLHSQYFVKLNSSISLKVTHWQSLLPRNQLMFHTLSLSKQNCAASAFPSKAIIYTCQIRKLHPLWVI